MAWQFFHNSAQQIPDDPGATRITADDAPPSKGRFVRSVHRVAGSDRVVVYIDPGFVSGQEKSGGDALAELAKAGYPGASVAPVIEEDTPPTPAG